MLYLGLAFYGEGVTDYRFLMPILYRAAHELCFQGQKSVDVGDIIEFNIKAGRERQRILKAAQKYAGGYDIVFIHADGGGDWQAAEKRHVTPTAQTLMDNLGMKRTQIVGVIPVREIEAWAMADGDALRDVFGTTLNDSKLGVPTKLRDVEKILDPKKSLEQALEQALGANTDAEIGPFYAPLGETISLKILRQIPSFQRFEQELNNSLIALGYI